MTELAARNAGTEVELANGNAVVLEFVGEIVSHDGLQRLDRLVEDTVALTRTCASIRQQRDAAYGF